MSKATRFAKRAQLYADDLSLLVHKYGVRMALLDDGDHRIWPVEDYEGSGEAGYGTDARTEICWRYGDWLTRRRKELGI